MLRSLAILAVLFAVTQAIVPATGQTADHDRGKSNAARSDSSPSQKKPASPKVIPQPPQSSTPQDHPRTSPEENNQQSVAITKAASISNKRDWVDYTSLAINAVLATIAIAGVIVAWCGLPGILRQAESAKIGADAAQKSADALVSAERGWVLARIDKTVVPFPYTTMLRIQDIVKCDLIFKNYGATPAIIESFSCQTQWTIPALEFPLPPQYGERKETRIILGPQEERIIGTVFPVDQFPDIPIESAVFIGYVNYGGIFEGQRGTKFCFGFDRETNSFIPIGPPAYNDVS